jgi:diguanylate cyclase (GGDEF)-like protein
MLWIGFVTVMKPLERLRKITRIRRYSPVGIAIAAGVIISTCVSAIVDQWQRTALQAQFQEKAEYLTEALKQRLNSDLETLFIISELQTISPEFGNNHSRQLIRSLLNQHTNIQAVQWLPATTSLKTNAIIPGIDLPSNPAGRSLLEQARPQQPVFSCTFPTQEAPGKPPTLLKILPVYRSTVTTPGRQNPSAQFEGFIVGVIHLSQLLQATLRELKLEGAQVQWLDRSATPEHQLLVAYNAPGNGRGVNATRTSLDSNQATLYCPHPSVCTYSLQIAEQSWALRLVSLPLPEGISAHSLPLYVLIFGLLWTIATSFYIFLAQRRNLLIAQQVQDSLDKHLKTQDALLQANDELLKANRRSVLFGELSDALQSCLTLTEAYGVIACSMEPLFPDLSGEVMVISNSKTLVETVAQWGSSLHTQTVFAPSECWALRRGRLHLTSDNQQGLICRHADSSPTANHLCVPMMAQGEALGVLHLNQLEGKPITETDRQLAISAAEQIAMALANLKLREMLQNQSIRDPLTGLFNRRFLEESLERELRRAAHNQRPLGVIMIDVDHFKQFNDRFGHDAGDAVLQKLGLFLKEFIRTSDIACRYGGEELVLILPEAPIEVTRRRAEQIRTAVKNLHLLHNSQLLGSITLSLGVASFPEHGSTAQGLIQLADAALYTAKREGRDRVCLAPLITQPVDELQLA